MKRKVVLLVGIIPFLANAQAFTEKPSVLKNFYYGSSSVQDVNNDGIADIFINGAIDPSNQSSPSMTYNQLYVVSNGELVDSHSLAGQGTHGGDIKVFDFNNDGQKDVVTSGINYSSGYKHFRHTNTGNGFSESLNEEGKVFSSIDVFDFNHDGRLDYAISGQDLQGQNVAFYQNSSGGFLPVTSFLDNGTTSGNFKVVDINNDQELDLIIIGSDANGHNICKTYVNTNGVLIEKQSFTGVVGRMDIADFNADGYIDFVTIGNDTTDSTFFAYYINDGAGNFTENVISDGGFDNGYVHCGDFNNDGYPDMVVSGDLDYVSKTEVYYYSPATQSFVKELQSGLHPLSGPGFINSLDVNGDNKLDLVVSGFDWDDSDYPTLTKLYENMASGTNAAPTPPTILNAVRTASGISFSWSGAGDDKTPVSGLSYELSVGTSQGASDIAKYEVRTTGWYLNLPQMPDEIYWSVRSIDASRVYSVPSSPQAMLSTLNVSKGGDIVRVYPNPAVDYFELSVGKGDVISVMIYSANGGLVRSIEGRDRYDVSDLEKGVYFIKINHKDGAKSSVEKLIKR